MLVLAAQIFPHAQGVWWQLGLLPVALVVLCAALALTETHTAKMRVLLVPRLLSAVSGRRAARHRRLARGDGERTVLVLVSVGLAVVIVRRRLSPSPW